MLIGWVPFTVTLFFVNSKPQNAVLVAIIGGWLFLPTIGYNLPGLPEYTKSAAISLGLILGGRLSGHRVAANFNFTRMDWFIVLWCLAPALSSLSNKLGLYDAMSGLYNQIMLWGAPYFAGRIYFSSIEDIKRLYFAVIIGGMIYAPLCLWEVRMSPHLSSTFYGFFPHSFAQHIRYGGYRPIVFMQHGLMVSLWMALSSVVAFWAWRGKIARDIKGIPILPIVAVLSITTVLCKSANAWFLTLLGFACYSVYKVSGSGKRLRLLVFFIFGYMIIRLFNLITIEDISAIAGMLFDEERIISLQARLSQENLFSLKSLQRPVFGWAGFGRGWPVDPRTGMTIRAVDSLWVIFFNKFGFFGLSTFLLSMLIGPWFVLNHTFDKQNGDGSYDKVVVALSLIVIFFLIDSLFNGMVNPIYILTSGALANLYHIKLQGGKK